MNMPIWRYQISIRIPFPVHNNINLLSPLLINQVFENEQRGYPPTTYKMEGYFTQKSPSLNFLNIFVSGAHPSFFELSVLPISPLKIDFVFETSHINSDRMLGSLDFNFKCNSPCFNSCGSWYSTKSKYKIRGGCN